MNNKASPAKCLSESEENAISEGQVADYLRDNPDFFARHDELLAEISLPHESGSAISLLERQVNILRARGTEARRKLNDLLENARSNDQLFETAQSLVLALLKAEDATEIVEVAQDHLSSHASVNACELIVMEREGLNIAPTVRSQSPNLLRTDFKDVFRLKRTHCGSLDQKKINHLFQHNGTSIRSTALCPIMYNGDMLAIIALGNQQDGYFNVHLDTLFLDFIGHAVGAVLGKHIATSQDR